MRCHVAITTYNRGAMLSKLLQQIELYHLKGKAKVSVYIQDDNSDASLSIVGKDSFKKISDYRMPIHYTYRMFHGGKEDYWILINDTFRVAQAVQDKWDYFFLLQDDLIIEPFFFEKMIDIWKKIDDERKVILNPLLLHSDKGIGNWTGITPIKLAIDNNLRIYRTGWTDCIFMSTHAGLGMLNWQVLPIDRRRWIGNPRLSSGVGQQLSQRILRAGGNMYQVARSLVHHGDHASLLNPDERRENPLVS